MSFIQISTQVMEYIRFHLKNSEELKIKIRSDFQKFDEDKDGVLSQNEMNKFIQDKIFKANKNIFQYDLDVEKTELLLKECDRDNDKNYTESEFCEFWIYLHIRSGEVLYKKIKENKGILMGKFSCYDSNGSNFLENDEIEAFFTKFNDSIRTVCHKFKSIEDFLEIYDLDKDGKLSFEEFAEAFFELNIIEYANKF